MKLKIFIFISLFCTSYLKLIAQNAANPVFQLSGFIGPIQIGLSGQMDINKRVSVQLSSGVGINVWNRNLTSYPSSYTKANTREKGGEFLDMLGGTYIWGAVFVELQGRYYFETSKRPNSNLAQGVFLGFRAKYNSSELSNKYNSDESSRYMTTTQLLAQVGIRRNFNNDKIFLEAGGGLGVMMNQDFKTSILTVRFV